MARRSARNRDTIAITSDPLSSLVPRPRPYQRWHRELGEVVTVTPWQWAVEQDLRRWDPEGINAPVRTRSGERARFVELYRPSTQVGHFGFRRPPNIMECIRRKIRREVLHALRLKKSGRGGSKKRDWRSDIKC